MGLVEPQPPSNRNVITEAVDHRQIMADDCAHSFMICQKVGAIQCR